MDFPNYAAAFHQHHFVDFPHVRPPFGWEAFVEWHEQRGKARATTQKHLSHVRRLLGALGEPNIYLMENLGFYLTQFEVVRAAVLALRPRLSPSTIRSYAMSVSLAATWPMLQLPEALIEQYREFWLSL